MSGCAKGGITDILLVISKQSAGQYTDFFGQRRGIWRLPDLQNPGGGRRHRGSAGAGGRIHPAGGTVCRAPGGDNLFMDSLEPYVKSYLQQPAGTAKVLLKPVEDARRYGVPVFDSADASLIAYIEEKPEQPKTKFCVTGIYMYDEAVFDIIRRISPSRRGELEITDVNNIYAAERKLSYDVLKGWWSDAGTFQSLREAGDKLRDTLP
ncbi:sugar phosphate nucleotidyltransferase [Paenibacillus rhizoplanae]